MNHGVSFATKLLGFHFTPVGAGLRIWRFSITSWHLSRELQKLLPPQWGLSWTLRLHGRKEIQFNWSCGRSAGHVLVMWSKCA